MPSIMEESRDTDNQEAGKESVAQSRRSVAKSVVSKASSRKSNVAESAVDSQVTKSRRGRKSKVPEPVEEKASEEDVSKI